MTSPNNPTALNTSPEVIAELIRRLAQTELILTEIDKKLTDVEARAEKLVSLILKNDSDAATVDLKQRTAEFSKKVAIEKKELEEHNKRTRKLFWASIGFLIVSLTGFAVTFRRYYDVKIVPR